jgi:ATP-binding cassette subfamily C (CFTR/MRP) protein 1
MMIVVAPAASVQFHSLLVNVCLNAPLSFFETFDSSVIVNRFSQDMNIIDIALPVTAWQMFLSESRLYIAQHCS